MTDTARFIFTAVLQGTQVVNAPIKSEDRMTSRVLFDVEYKGQRLTGGQADIQQPYGTKYEGNSIEVLSQTMPAGLPKRPKYLPFCEAIERYYRRKAVGGPGAAIVIGQDVSGLVMRNNIMAGGIAADLPLED